MVIQTIELQFPKINCMICLDDDVKCDNIYNQFECTHISCVCSTCKHALINEGEPVKGKIILNSNYQCPCCFKFDINLYISNAQLEYSSYTSDFIKFLENGGVHSGYTGRFCNRCILPFQEKNSCGTESVEMSLYCPPCAEMIMQLNLSTRQFVACPCCNIMVERSGGCDIVTCRYKSCTCENQMYCFHEYTHGCGQQFCYGCNFVFIYGAEVDWICTCLITGTNPREYKDPSFSSCKTKFKKQINQKLERMLSNVLQNMQDRGINSRPIRNTPIVDRNEVLEQLRIAEEIGDDDAILFNRLALLD